MAVTSIWKIDTKLAKVIKYTTNGKKTENENFDSEEINYNDLHHTMEYVKADYKTEQQYFVTGINCEKESALEEMIDTKKFFHKEGGILGFHAIQSFAEGEVTPKIAHEIGVKFAKEMWGDNFEVIVSTHLNTRNIHNHIVINSISFKDGKRYYDNHSNYAIMRHLSDEICKEYGLKILKEKPTKKNIIYDNFYKKSLYNDSYSKNAKRDLDLAIRQAYSYDDFIYLMNKMDYEIIIRAGKLSIKKNKYSRNIRVERRFGEEYTIDNIKRRIIEERAIRVPFIENIYNYRKIYFPFAKRHKRAKAKGFIALYYHYCYLLKVFPNKVPQQRLPASIRADISKMEELSIEARFLVNNKIKKIDELLTYKDEINIKINRLLTDRESLWTIRKLSKDENYKHKLAVKISSLTKELDKLRKEVDICENIKSRVVKIDENLSELDTQEEIAKETKDKKSKTIKQKRKE